MAYERYNAGNEALLLIDHQVDTMERMHFGPKDVMRRNTVALANAAAITDMPVVPTSSQGNNGQGPLFPDLKNILPSAFTVRVKRAGGDTD